MSDTICTDNGKRKNEATMTVTKDEVLEALETQIKILSTQEFEAFKNSYVIDDMMYDIEDYMNEELMNNVWDYIRSWIRDMKKEIAKKIK